MLTDKTKQARANLAALPCLSLNPKQIEFIYRTCDFKQQLIQQIRTAKKRILITALYWQKDDAGEEILQEVLNAKRNNPALDVKILVDWHRAQRNLLGAEKTQTNAEWYCQCRDDLCKHQPDLAHIFYGVPINTREVFGVLHIKGFIFDDTVLYSGASINDVYVHQCEKYRYDRYHKITNAPLANAMAAFIEDFLLKNEAVYGLDCEHRPKTKEIRQTIRNFRRDLARDGAYHLPEPDGKPYELTITPLFGMGKGDNRLNHVIEDLFQIVQEKLTICTPYFNFPKPLQKRLKSLLKAGKKVEIIVGDKTANDFYIPPEQPFKMAGALPYLYENNLRCFTEKFNDYLKTGQLCVRIWKDGDNSYHLKGVWADEDYILLTGNNLNPRAWRLDAENGLLIHDPQQQLTELALKELNHIRQNTTLLTCFNELESMVDYPAPVQKLLKKFARIRADKIVKMIL